MNYYNSRKKEWLQFVDVQYNVNNENMVFYVKDATDLEEMIYDHHSEIGIKITPAGKAYLDYFVQSFEYFACRKNGQIPPLLTLIPEENELFDYDEINLECLNAIDNVFIDTNKCINQMREIADNERIVYRRTINALPKKHDDRIIDSHIGYINNFQQCVKKKYVNISLSDDSEKNLNKLLGELDSRKRKYEGLREV